MNNRVVLIKDYRVASAFAAQLQADGIPFATVEAEYGDFCIEGSHATLAHHVSKYRDAKAPCIRTDVTPLKDGVILISHLDLDTLGGIALLEDCYFVHSFWESEAIIDTQGALGVPLIPEEDNDLMKIYWAWETSSDVLALPQRLPILDVTEQVLIRLTFLNQLLRKELSSFLYDYYLETFNRQLVEYSKTCVYEDEYLRLFVNEEPMHFQLHERNGSWVDICIHYNPKRKTLILSDISRRIDCGAFMKECFGDKAGGQFRIGGTPRDASYSLFTAYYLKEVIQERFLS